MVLRATVTGGYELPQYERLLTTTQPSLQLQLKDFFPEKNKTMETYFCAVPRSYFQSNLIQWERPTRNSGGTSHIMGSLDE